MARFTIKFGVLSDGLYDQLDSQGFDFDPGDIRWFQSYADAITELSIAGLLSEKSVRAARGRLLQRIAANIVRKTEVTE